MATAYFPDDSQEISNVDLCRNLPLKIMFSCFLVMALRASAARADFYDAARDFASSSNPIGVWSYGESLTLGSSFILDAIHQNTGNLDFWEGNIADGSPPGSFPTVFHNGTNSTIIYAGTVSLDPGQLAMHPGPNDQYSIVRFTAPTTGSYLLSSAFTGADFTGPTTTDVHVLFNGSSIFDGSVNSFGVGPSFARTLDLKSGDTVDFAVGFGSNSNFHNDSTRLSATFTTGSVPEPGSLILLSTGAMLIAGHGALRHRSRPSASSRSRVRPTD